MELNGDNLRMIREALGGLNQTEFARLIGASQGRYSKWERDENKPSGDYAVRILELAAQAGITGNAVPLGAGSTGTRRIRIIGELQAGTWKEAIEWPHDDQTEIVITPPPGLEKYQVQGFIVRGESMNMYYPSGSLVFVEPTISSGKNPKSGQRVLVQRRNRDGLYEATIKEYVVNDDGSRWLWPRSHHPEHQAPIAYRDTDTEEVTITGIVRASFSMEP